MAGIVLPGDGSVITQSTTYTVTLTVSSNTPTLLAPFSDVLDPAEAQLTPALNVAAPSRQCPHLVGRVSPAVAIPRSSNVRAIEGYWNGQRLPLVPVFGTASAELEEEAHSYGPSMIPFNAPLYSLDGMVPGPGTLEIRGYDAGYKEVVIYRIAGLILVGAPAATPTATLASLPHPRVLLTASRLANAAAKLAANDAMAVRFNMALDRFLQALALYPDPNSAAFANAIYDPAGYLPALGLCYQLNKRASDPALVARGKHCADAARALAVKIANDYNGADAVTKFSRDTGYDIREGHLRMMLAFDWIHEVLTADERALIVKVTTTWVDWYTNDPGAYSRSRPLNNYYSPYLQALMFTGIGTAGENDAADRLLTLLRSKLASELPVANQRACGGDWPEGGNYGPAALTAHLFVAAALKDVGEDWSAAYDFVQPLARNYRYQITADGAEMLPFGGFSGISPHKTSPSLLAILSSTTSDGAFASGLFNLLQANLNNDFFDASSGQTAYEMLFGDSTKNPDVSMLPLSYFNPGTGRFFSKSSLVDPAAYQVATENMHYAFDHFGYANGDVRFYHGGTCLLCSSTYRGTAFNGEDETPAFSTFQANDQVQANDRNNQVLFVKEGVGYSAIGMRFESSFAADRFDEGIFSPATPLDYLIREVVHVRPGVLVIRDLSRRRHAADSLVSRFHLGPTDEPVNGAPGQIQVGALHISSFSSLAVAPAFTNDVDQQGTVVGKQMALRFPASTDAVEAVTVLSDTGVGLAGYTGGVARLSNQQCVTFANGDLSVGPCP